MKVFLMSAVVFAFGAGAAMADDIPVDLLGKWAIDGACDDPEAITITADTLAFGTGEADGIVYWPDDSPAGNGAIHWAEEGVVDNFEYDPTQDVLLHNGEGYGMGVAPDTYKRCS